MRIFGTGPAYLITLICGALSAFVDVKIGCVAYLLACYVLLAIAALLKRGTRPSWELVVQKSPNLDLAARQAYQRFYLYVTYPFAANGMSDCLNTLRILSVIWIGISIWDGSYIIAAVIAAYYFASAPTIADLHPVLYFGEAAKRGNEVARLHYGPLLRVLEARENDEIGWRAADRNDSSRT